MGVAIVALSRSSYALSSQHVEDATEEFAQADVDEDQPNWQMVQQERDLCSKPKEDCLKTQCCKTSGYKCYKQPAGNVGKCMRYCKKKGCTLVDKMVHLQVEAPNGILAPAETMFCFSVYTQNTGSTKKSTERELLTEQHKRQVSIFACNAFAVYSDVAVDLGGGTSTIKVSDVDEDFHFAKRKSTGAWVNTGMFSQVWKTIASGGKYQSADWVAKVDADAVFVPSRPSKILQSQLVPPSGIYLENCKYVDYGYFGNLEVFSQAAFATLVEKIDVCKADSQIDWKVGIKNGKYGPMGEDLFAQTCLDSWDV